MKLTHFKKLKPEKLIAVFLIFHLSLVILASLPESILFRALPKVAIVYLNQVGLNNPWNMFAPDPMPDLKIGLSYYPNTEVTEPSYTQAYPKNKSLYGLSKIRHYYTLNYFLATQKRIYDDLEPILCHQKVSGLRRGYWVLSTQRLDANGDYDLSNERLMACEKE